MKKVKLENIPKLNVMVLRFAFVGVEELEMKNASMLESHEVLGELMSRLSFSEKGKCSKADEERSEEGKKRD